MYSAMSPENDSAGCAEPATDLQSKRHELALLQWDSEGGAAAMNVPAVRMAGALQDAEPALTNAELAHLRVRVVALENLMLALLAQASDEQLHLARERAACISPRPGFTAHPLTLHAAVQMMHLVGHAGQLCGGPPAAV